MNMNSIAMNYHYNPLLFPQDFQNGNQSKTTFLDISDNF